MSGDSVHDFDALTHRVESLGDHVARLETLRDRLTSELDARKAEVVELSVKVEKLSKVEALFRALMDALVVKQMKTFEGVITEGLQTIFHDQDLHFETEVGPKRNKISIDFFIRQGADDDPVPIRGRPLDSFGGGPTCLASFILRVLALRRLKKFPMLAMDETLNAVSDDYIDNTGRFLQSLAKDVGFDLLLVTHKPAYTEHADRAYQSRDEIKGGRSRLHLKALS